MLGTTSLAGSSGEGSGGGGEAVVGSSGDASIMTGIGEDEKATGGGNEGGGAGELFEGDRGSAGNRWPRQETLDLIRIRSEMDVAFRDSSLKGPLWEEVSRKMGELGYHRSAKKCKEKFENVYKYHKRTKEGRVGKSEGKTYRFFDQLQALEHHNSSSSSILPPLPPHPPRAQSQPPPEAAVPVSMVIPAGANVTVSSTTLHPINVVHSHQMNVTNNPNNHQIPQPQQMPMGAGVNPAHPGPIQMENLSSPSATLSSSSSTSSDEEVLGRRKRKRKRKWKGFFERMMKEMIDKQEEMQNKFLEAVEKREKDRLVREEAWKVQEMARLKREHEILVQERSMAAAKDAALIAFLQKVSDQEQIPMPLPIQAQAQPQAHVQPHSQPQPQAQPQVVHQIQVSMPPVTPALQPQPQPQQPPPQHGDNVGPQKTGNGDSPTPASSSRWPKAEVEALINLRTRLDQKYQESGPKGPLWEEISASMRKLGYNRNAKRCKEKWENINKYFKKVKESNKKRPEDSKTCPYFHQLDALYKEKNKTEIISSNINPTTATTTITYYGQQENLMNNLSSSMGPIVARSEQQWPHSDPGMEDPASENRDDSDIEGDEDEDDDDDDDDDDQGRGYEIVANNSSNNNNDNNANAGGSVTTTTTATTTATAE